VLERPGFYPAGGGRFTVRVTPATSLTPLALLERGAPVARAARREAGARLGGFGAAGRGGSHTTTNIDVIRRFLDVPIATTPTADGVTVQVGR